MALNVYRRHRRNCYGGHAEDSSSSFLQERAKGWKRCDCDVHVSGTLAGRYARKATGTADWEQARLIVERLERAASWTAEAPPLPAPPAPEPTAPPAPEPTPAAS
jgi:sRNA-binding protein